MTFLPTGEAGFQKDREGWTCSCLPDDSERVLGKDICFHLRLRGEVSLPSSLSLCLTVSSVVGTVGADGQPLSGTAWFREQT